MAEFIRLTLAVLTANLLTVVFVYCLNLISKGEVRRAASIFAASMLALGGLIGGIAMGMSGVGGIFWGSTFFAGIVGGIWLVNDIAFPELRNRSR